MEEKPDLGADGRPHRHDSNHPDSAGRVVAEAETQGNLQLFRLIAESVAAGAILFSNDKVIYINKAAKRITGFTQEDFLGKVSWEGIHPESRQRMQEIYMARLRGEAVDSHFELHLITKSGAETLVEVHTIDTEYQGAPAVLVTYVDITKRKHAEKALQDSHDDLEQMVLQRTAQLAQANLKLEEDVRQREQAEADLLRRNAKLIDLNARLGEVQGQLLQSEKMASIGQLAAGVAHEINNPIGYVQTNMGSLESYLGDLFRILDAYAGTDEALPADLQACVEVQRLKAELDLDFLREDIPKLMTESREGITRVSKIVQDLKDFSRVDTNQEWKWADLHRGLDSTLNVVNNEIKYKADVVKEYGDLPEVECLPSELNQVFLNLLVNAAHAIPDGERGTITLRSGCDDKQVWIEVADTGSGIAPENLKCIFDPFFTTKPIGKGTGLGLSLSYGIVKKHGGSIEVHSEVGKGSTFRVILPISQAHEEVVP